MAVAPVKSGSLQHLVVCSFCDQPPYQATLTKCGHLFCQKRECLLAALARNSCALCSTVTQQSECLTINAHLKVIAYYLSHQPELFHSKIGNINADVCSICTEDNDPPVHFITQHSVKEKIGEFFCNRCFSGAKNIEVPGRVFRSLTPFQVVALTKDLPPIPSLSLSFSGLTALANAAIRILVSSTPEVCFICDKAPYKATLTKCGHLFCQKKSCLENTFKPEGPCPVCRTVTNLQDCETIDQHLKVIAHALSQSPELVNSKLDKLVSGRCTICLNDDDPAIRFIIRNPVKEKVGKFLCHSCFDAMGQIPASGRVYQALTPFQIVALSKELPPLTSPSYYISTTFVAMMLMSFCHRVINENTFENQNGLLAVTSLPADMTIKIVNFCLMLIKKQSSSK